MNKPETWEETHYYWTCPDCGCIGEVGEGYISRFVCQNCMYIYAED